MRALLSGFNDMPPRRINDNEVRRVRYQQGQISEETQQYPVSVTWKGIFDEHKVTWKHSIQKKGQYRQDEQVTEFSKQLQQNVNEGKDVLLPLCAYYGTDRLWIPEEKKDDKTVEVVPRTWGYKNCLHPDSNIKQLREWFEKQEEKALRQNHSVEALQLVRDALKKCMEEDWQNITYDFIEGELVAEFTDGRKLPVEVLSDGVRNMLAMVADIAYRAVVLNPQLGRNAATQTPGIVLIDEIDLHLHPKWQRGIVESLQNTFPAIQFVVTTHSPFIVQSLRNGELINLDSQVEEAQEYYDQSIEDVTEKVMGVYLPQKSERSQRMMEVAKEYYRVLREAQNVNSERVEQLKAKLDELSMPFSDDIAYHAFLEMEREAAGLGRGGTK